MIQSTLTPANSLWRKVNRANKVARELADRHYSRKTIGASQFTGPGECLVLLTYDNKALFVWRLAKYRRDGLTGVECTIFRNESETKSSILIIDAVNWAKAKWPLENIFTYVKAEAIKSTYPGYCFKAAGWNKVHGYRSKDQGLHLLVVPGTGAEATA